MSIRDLCIRCNETFSGRNGRFISPIARFHDRLELSLDGWIILERGLFHRLESSPSLPAPATCTPLQSHQQDLTNSHCSYEPWLRTAKHQLAPQGHSSRNYVLKNLCLVKAACLTADTAYNKTEVLCITASTRADN